MKKNTKRAHRVAVVAACVALTSCCVGVAFAEQSSSSEPVVGTNAFAAQHASFVADDGTLPDCEGCHDMEEVAAKTADWNGNTAMNPHSAHVPLDCSYCHTLEGDTQTMFCATCHTMALPEGWTARPRIGGQSQL